MGYTALSAALYLLSIVGFACWTVAASLHWRDRRYSACALFLLFVTTNFLAWVYDSDPASFVNAQYLAHPALLTVSPVAAAHHWMGVVGDMFWTTAWNAPKYKFLLPFAYQIVFLLSGLVAMRWESHNVPKEFARPEADDAKATEFAGEQMA